MAKTKVLITLGPTQEPIDDIRFISNKSSGRMGAALAEEGIKRGHDITIIHGPVSVPLPGAAKKIPVSTAKEMLDAVLAEYNDCYIFISAAAVADYTPVEIAPGKIKSGQEITLHLKPTPKLIHEVRKLAPDMRIVAFKVESGGDLVARAKELLEDADLVVANDASAMGSDTNEVYLVSKTGVEHVGPASKKLIANAVWDELD